MIQILATIMTEWTPISSNALFIEIQKSEMELEGELLNFWQLIRIEPTKWAEKEFGQRGDGFWVVAICGTKIIWYNDIEDGFNISKYSIFGEIECYSCNQDELSLAVSQLYQTVKIDVE
jgi:hypothetical protein